MQARIDGLDTSVLSQVPNGGMSPADAASLLAIHAAMARRGKFRYLEVGSYLGSSLQSFIADPRCIGAVSIDRRDTVSPDERERAPEYPGNTSQAMLERLAGVQDADLTKLTVVDATTGALDPRDYKADLCLIDAEHTNEAALADARFCCRVLRDAGVIVFHDRTLVQRGIVEFLRRLTRYRAYPLANDLFVVEIGIPSLLKDERVGQRVVRPIWRVASRIGLSRSMLTLTGALRPLSAIVGAGVLAIGAPRRAVHRGYQSHQALTGPTFEISTFVTDQEQYGAMQSSFRKGGFADDGFIELKDTNTDPYQAIRRFGEGNVQYPILCHQDVRLLPGAGRAELVKIIQALDMLDPTWVVAGNAGVRRDGHVIREFVNPAHVSFREPAAFAAVSLDENFLVFNARNRPHTSAGLSGFHLYGTDVCLHALARGEAAYVINFPTVHLSGGTMNDAYRAAEIRLAEAWHPRSVFRYIVSPCGTTFASRFRVLRAMFGSRAAMGSVISAQARFR